MYIFFLRPPLRPNLHPKPQTRTPNHLSENQHPEIPNQTTNRLPKAHHLDLHLPDLVTRPANQNLGFPLHQPKVRMDSVGLHCLQHCRHGAQLLQGGGGFALLD